MTVKAGQKCTAIRRAMAPAEHLDAVEAGARASGWPATKVGDPRAEDTRMGALVSLSPARRRPRQDRRARSRGRADRRRRSRRRTRPVAGGAFLSPVLLRTDDPVGDDGRPRCRAVRPGLDHHALPGHGRCDRARQPRHGQPGAVAVHPFARRGARFHPGRGRLSRPDAGHRPHQCRRNRPATARPCPSSSTAAPAAPAAARRWAACAA